MLKYLKKRLTYTVLGYIIYKTKFGKILEKNYKNHYLEDINHVKSN